MLKTLPNLLFRGSSEGGKIPQIRNERIGICALYEICIYLSLLPAEKVNSSRGVLEANIVVSYSW